jgi:hypothetical protein
MNEGRAACTTAKWYRRDQRSLIRGSVCRRILLGLFYGEGDETITDQSGGSSDYQPVDLDELMDRNEPLANLVRTLQLSNTWRDNAQAIAEDLSIALKVQDENSELGQAFLEWKASVESSGEIDVSGTSRRDLASLILDELEPG